MAAQNVDWGAWGAKTLELYASGLSFKKVADRLNELGLRVKPSTVHAFLVRNNAVRTREQAQKIAREKGSHDQLVECKHCSTEFMAKAGNQKWCDVCVPDDQSYHRLLRYKMSAPHYDALLASQGGHCALCPSTAKLVVDHDHSTGEIRGLLCYACNIALGRVDVPGWIDAAKRFVSNQHDQVPGVFTPELIDEMKRLGDRAADLHNFLSQTDLVC